MIKEIRLKNYESHKETTLKDLSPGFNLIFGVSNHGKTSIARGLRVVAHNDFDQRSIRVGAKFAEIGITTHKGSVDAIKGKTRNEWTVSGYEDSFKNIGVKPLPQAEEVLGFGLVELGEVKLSLNIMNQKEAHFMLREMGDKKATGSQRALVIDEISGLSGIETIIKSVSTDKLRATKKVNELSTELEKLKERLHDKDELETEADVLTQCEELLDDHQNALVLAKETVQIRDAYKSQKAEMDETISILKGMPDVSLILSKTDELNNILSHLNLLREIKESAKNVMTAGKAVKQRLTEMPDTERLNTFIGDASGKLAELGEVRSLQNSHKQSVDKEDKTKEKLGALPDTSRCFEMAEKVSALLDKLAQAMRTKNDFLRKRKEGLAVKSQVEDKTIELDDLNLEIAEFKATFTVCPLSLKPISKDCLA